MGEKEHGKPYSHFPFDRVQSWIGDADDYYMQWASSVPMVVISEQARLAITMPLTIAGVVHHGLPIALFQPTVKQPERFFGKIFSGNFAYQGARPLLLAPATTVRSTSPLTVKTGPSVRVPYQTSRAVRQVMEAGENAVE